MILTALTQYYERLAAQNRIPPIGFAPAKVSYALCLDERGGLVQTVCLLDRVTRGKKETLVPRIMEAPEPVKRTAGIAANFLCDNASYLLGIDQKGRPARTAQCFAAAKARHETLLGGVDSPAARAVLAFFDRWNPNGAADHPALRESWEGLTGGANLVFRFDGAFVQDDPGVREAWLRRASFAGRAAPCLVTGRTDAPPARLHPSIKGVAGAQSSGASLVSFNAEAFCSYGKEQGENAPVSQYAASAYGAALNWLLSDREHRQTIGDATVVFWSEDGDPILQDLGMGALFGPGDRISHADLKRAMGDLAQGRKTNWEDREIDPDTPFYILGISPNAARLSVRFFWRNTLGGLMERSKAHYDRLEIQVPAYEKFHDLPVWRLLGETVSQNSRDRIPSPVMAGDVMRAILNDGPYPASLEHGVLLRIRAEQDVTWRRAAILKAIVQKNLPDSHPAKEVAAMELNENSCYQPYVLGRMFALFACIQKNALPNINVTIKDKYFGSAASTPLTIFPVLTAFAQNHLKKLSTGSRIYFEKKLAALHDKITYTLPSRHTLAEQEAFYIGYYHQTQSLYAKKEEK